jgi:hypothetical protein
MFSREKSNSCLPCSNMCPVLLLLLLYTCLRQSWRPGSYSFGYLPDCNNKP